MTPTKARTLTLQEHLHNQLQQLIAVDFPNVDGKVSQNGFNNKLGADPKDILKSSINDERQQNKVKVVTRLLHTLREDQSSIPKNITEQQYDQSNTCLTGRIHGCVGSHWELLPPVYAENSDVTDNEKTGDSIVNHSISKEELNNSITGDKESPGRKRSESVSSWFFPISHKVENASDGEESNSYTDEIQPTERTYPSIRGGGLRLPGLDWSRTFRKGYSVLVWVRPTLNCTQTLIPDGAAIRKQVLYRFSTSLHDNIIGAVGICAILGQWQAISCEDESSDTSRTLLTTTVTAYTLPNSDPMSHLYPVGKATKQATHDAESTPEKKSAHARNMELFNQHQSNQRASSSNKGRLSKHNYKKMKNASSLKKSEDYTASSPSATGGYLTAQLTLPADEWSLIAIQHTHPYLRRPELSISVNGEEMGKGELAYPVLDAVESSSNDDITTGLSSVTISQSSSNPRTLNDDIMLGASTTFLNDNERKMLQRRGHLAECTLLDGAFENGVLLDEDDEKLNCALSVHSLTVLSGLVPPAVLSMISERGPMGDSASGSGLSFLLGPVPTNPQNRDAVVALLAGFGYYGNGIKSAGIGGSGQAQDKVVAPPRSIGLPVSVGITPGASRRKGGKTFRGSDSESHEASSWIGREEEHDAHILLQSLVGHAILTFHSSDTRCLGQVDANSNILTSQGRIICQPSSAPSHIGGADEVPKVGIVRPEPAPATHSKSANMELTGNASYHNLTSSYIHNEGIREQIQINSSADSNINHADNPPVSFTRAIHAADVANCVLLPFRLALPRIGCEEVNSAQQTLHFESFVHLSDLFANQSQLSGLLIELFNECILCSGGSMRDESVQSGTLHAMVNLLRRVLIRGARLGLLVSKGNTHKPIGNFSTGENMDYDQDHESCCPQVIPLSIRKALIQSIDVCCGPAFIRAKSLDNFPTTVSNPNRGLLRIRRTSDLALTAFYGLAFDWDLFGKDLTSSASIITAISERYCKESSHDEPFYGSLLRSQTNIQYFLDSIRVRFDDCVSKHLDEVSDGEREALELIADSLSDILYSMLLSSLTSSSGSAVTRGERDIGALVASLTECSFGSVCASVVTTSIAKLLIKCGVFSPLCLERVSTGEVQASRRKRDTVDLALENRLARNMLLCHYHDIVCPFLLSKSAPNYSIKPLHSGGENEDSSKSQSLASYNVGMTSYSGILDWSHAWRLSLLTFSWLSSLAGYDERVSISQETGELILEAARARSLDGALLAKGTDVISALSYFLVLNPSGEKDNNFAAKADTISRRLSVFMQLIPGITFSILSPSIKPSDAGFFVVSDQTAIASGLLKDILSMLSLSIQSLYKKGGLLSTKPGSSETVQRQRAKTVFAQAAKEYAPILLHVVSMLERPIKACKNNAGASSTGSKQPEVERTRTDSTDKDWVEVHSEDIPSVVLVKAATGVPSSGQKAYSDLVSCRDMALYAISRLIAQAMKYGGGEASTSVWRVIISTLSIDEGIASSESDKDGHTTTKDIDPRSNETLCHLIALVLSKFSRNHDKGGQSTRSQWNTETCSAVARLMDLVEEKKLLINRPNEPTIKFSIEQVRLIKSVLEIMRSGRDCLGWLQVQNTNNQQIRQRDDAALDHTSKAISEASTHNNHQVHMQQTQTLSGTTRQSPKLLLPILQSCLRLMLPSMGIIRSEAVVISATSPGQAPSTAILLQLVAVELNESITAAILGLVFSTSRDIFMNATMLLQQSLEYHRNVNDKKAVVICSELILSTIDAMRNRYESDKGRKNNKASNGSNDEGTGDVSNQGDFVEQLILGQDEVPLNDSSDVDFLAFSGGNGKPNTHMGFMQYKGLGAALNRCFQELNGKDQLSEISVRPSCKTQEDKANLVLSILDPFIQNWNKAMAHDDEEQELVDLFDENQADMTSSSRANKLLSLDAVSRFIEAQSMLKQQHSILLEYLVGRRFGRTAFTERLCWQTWMGFVDAESCNALWERGVYDGGRDYYSKMVTMPLFPQFPRFIPSYLDHSPSSLSAAAPTPEIDLKGKGIQIVDITKKELNEEAMDQLYDDDDCVDDTPANFQEEDLDVLFNHRESQSSIKLEDAASEERNDEEAEAGPQIKKESMKFDSPDIANGESINLAERSNFHFATSSFSFPPDTSSLLSMGQGVRLAGGLMEEYYSSCLHVKPDCSRKCIVMLTESHLILEFEDGDGSDEGDSVSYQKKIRDSLHDDELQDYNQKMLMDKAVRPKAIRWNISEASHIYLRRYRLRDSALEIFFIPSAGATTGGTGFFAGSRSLFLDFGSGTFGNTRRDDAANALMRRAPMQTVKQWPDRSGQFLHDELKKLTKAWSQGAISNFDYLSSLNCLSGRSYNDICQYPVFPWTLCNFMSDTIPDLTDRDNYRDLSKPIGALNEERLAEVIERFETFDDPSIPPFMYGSHYSTSAGVVLHFLLRLHPYSSLHRQLQGGHFDVADRLFSSVQRTWEMCTGRSAAEVKELTPEFYCNPAFLSNKNELKLGTMQEGEVVNDVALPPWANGSPEKFVEVMRIALESDIVSDTLPSWIDLIFGYKQQGKHAIEAHNVFFYLTYYGSVDVASIEDEGLRIATECQIAHFGQCPMQLFYRPHIKKRDRSKFDGRQTLSETLSLYDSSHANKTLPFMGSPMSYWVHLAAPPPGPHAPLVSIRLALSDRCLAIDSKGVYHFFRWAWKAEAVDEDSEEEGDELKETSPHDTYRDKGCFVAQRELMSFRTIPCLPYTPISTTGARHATMCMSKTLFSNRTLLLVLSDGDGKGSLAMQLVDPVKGAIKGEVIVPSAHSDYITSIDMDPIGTAAGQGGVGGELAVVGSADGSMTMWRFISSHYWPLRPRLRMTGHSGSKVHGVAISSALGICASISSQKCCLFDVGNGAMIRAMLPPVAACRDHLGSNLFDDAATIQVTTFADTPAFCLSVLGYIVVVCSTKLIRGDETLDEVFSVELITLEGVHVGSKILEPDRGIPNKLFSSVDGRAVFVCAGQGASVCLISSVHPLSFVDEWRFTEDIGDGNTLAQQAIHDIDFGPTISRPVVVAAGCSDGSLRLHALQGISKWSNENQRNIVTSAVGSVLALPAQTVKNAIGGVAGFGSRFVGLGKEIGKEAFTVVKEREGFFGRKR